jgi:4'-phosphopantetheinyl transferase
VDRSRFTVAAVMLRMAAGAVLGRRPGDVEIDRTCPTCGSPHGRPRLPGTTLHASISHGGERVVVALTDAGPVGVDVEAIGAVEAGVVKHTSSPAEPFVIDNAHEFFVHWTRKEAVLKATGAGLTRAMATIELGPPDEPPRLVHYGDRTEITAAMADLDAGPGHVASVAVLGAAQIVAQRHDGAILLGLSRHPQTDPTLPRR